MESRCRLVSVLKSQFGHFLPSEKNVLWVLLLASLFSRIQILNAFLLMMPVRVCHIPNFFGAIKIWPKRVGTVSRACTGTDQNFITGFRSSWKSASCIKLEIRPKTLLFVADIFVIFLLSCDILVTRPCLICRVRWFNIFVFVVSGALGLLLWLKSKKH